MLKEDVLKAYLEDELFIENGYLKEGEAANYKWATATNNSLIQVIKLAIEGDMSYESSNVTEQKINKLLNQRQS